MQFVAMVFKLNCFTRQPRLTVGYGVYAHAAIMHAISREDAIAGQILHDMHRNKCLSASLVTGTSNETLLRLSFMSSVGLQYASTLVNALSNSPQLRLGEHIVEITAIDLTDPIWSGVSTWADLTTTTAARKLRFTFVTPTAITKLDRTGQRFMALCPDPLDLFMGLTRRWQAMDGPTLPVSLKDYLREGGCVMSNYQLSTTEFHTTERTQLGFVGNVVYECRIEEAEHIAALQALTRLAFFTGAGYQTARGMGTVRTSVTK